MHPLQSVLTLALAGSALAAAAQTQPQPQPPAAAPAGEQVIVPQVERRPVKLPRFPSNDFEISLFAGTYATQNFGASAVSGLRLGYHITEDFFVEGAYGRSKVSDEAFRQVLPGGIFVNRSEALTYYNVSAGYNLLPGEVFFGRGTAKASAGYVIGGVGSTRFNGQKRQTINLGFGLRLILSDRFALRADVRDHLFSLDLLGKRQSTQNLEVNVGLGVFF